MDELPTLTPLKSVAVLGLGVVFKDSYDTYILQVCCILIDILFAVLHVRFEDMLSVSVLENRATCHRNSTPEIV
jgi:hypothetical protein